MKHSILTQMLLVPLFFAWIACSPLGIQGQLGQNTFGDTTDISDVDGFTPDGQETPATVTFGQLSDGKCRVTIPLSILDVTLEEFAMLEVAIIYEDNSQRAYALDPQPLYSEPSDAIVFVINQLSEGDWLSITLALPEGDVTFAASVSSAGTTSAEEL